MNFWMFTASLFLFHTLGPKSELFACLYFPRECANFLENDTDWLPSSLALWVCLTEPGQCSVLPNPAGHAAALLPSHHSEQWYLVFVSWGFVLGLLEVYKKNFGILYVSAWDRLLSALHYFSCFFCYQCLPPQHVDRPEGVDWQEQFESLQWQMESSTPGMHEHLSVPQSEDSLFREQLCGEDLGLQVGRGIGIFL